LKEVLFVGRQFRLFALLLASALFGPVAVIGQDATPVSDNTPTFGYQVVAEYPHDRRAFTQGLVYVDEVLYEGTGLYGESTLRRVDLETGEVLQAVGLTEEYFGEGIAVVDDRIYQLTWRNGVCVVFDRETFAVLGAFTYPANGWLQQFIHGNALSRLVNALGYPTEGWGLTTDGDRLIMSDGSNRLFVRDPRRLTSSPPSMSMTATARSESQRTGDG
jgi:glutamine cyclotransferase